MIKTLFAVAILAITAGFVTPSFAQDAEVHRILEKMLADSKAQLEKSARETPPLFPLPAYPYKTPQVHVYTPRDYSRPGPPVGNYDALNSLSGTRPSCMPYYEGCSGQ